MTTRDWINDAQKAAEEHIEAVWDAWNDEQDGDSDGSDSPAIGPYCGCVTCEVREILHAAVPLIAAGIVAGDIDPKDLTP